MNKEEKFFEDIRISFNMGDSVGRRGARQDELQFLFDLGEDLREMQRAYMYEERESVERRIASKIQQRLLHLEKLVELPKGDTK